MFQPVDQHVNIGASSYTLRLTLGALAEISQRLNAQGPKALSAQMKNLTPQAAAVILTALLRPCHSANMPDVRQPDLSPELFKAVALIFEDSFKALYVGRKNAPS